MTIVVEDNFDTLGEAVSLSGRTPSPTTAGFNWTVRNGTNIEGATGGGALKVAADGGGNPDQCGVDTGTVEQKVTATITNTTDSEGQISSRGSGGGQPANCYYYRFRTTTNVRQLRRRDSGVNTTLDATNMPSNTAGGDVMALEVSGTGATVTLKTYRNGVQIGSDFSDTSANRKTTGSFAGLEHIGGSPVFDDFSVDNLAAGGGGGDRPKHLLMIGCGD